MDIVEKDGLFLDALDSERLWKLGNEFALHYNWLASNSIRNGARRYNLVFKIHFLHIIWYCRFQHHRAFWCYIYEDFVGRIKRLAVSCARGTPAHRLPYKVVAQYTIALGVKLSASGIA